MKPARCAMAPLFEARRDGRLGDRESASLDRHVGTCAACRALERDLDHLRTLLRNDGDPRPTPLDHQRGRLTLLRAAALPPAPPRRRPLAIGASIALAGTVLGAAAFAFVRHAPPATPQAATEAGAAGAPSSTTSPPGDLATETAGAPTPPIQPGPAPRVEEVAVEEAATPLVRGPKREALVVRASVRMPGAAAHAPRGPEVATSKAFGEAIDLQGRGD
jgi:hypothetical protein